MRFRPSSCVTTNGLSPHHKGPFIFYEVGGAGGIWGGHPQKNGLEGGPSKKNKGKGGSRKILPNFVTGGGHATS